MGTATLGSYVPPTLAAMLREGGGARARRTEGAVLFADISGFSALARVLAGRRAAGTETLSRALQSFFGAVLDRVTLHGGAVLRFAGDAPIAVWPADGDLPLAVRRAARCALALQRDLRDFDAGEGVRISMRVGVGAGPLVALTVGGVEGRWEYLLGGAALSQACAAESRAGVGEAWLSPAAWATARDVVVGEACGDHLRLERVDAADPPATAEPAPADPALRAFVSRVALTRLDASLGDWLAELRRISVLFASLDGVDFDAPDVPARLQRVVEVLQAVVYQYGGSVNQLVVDDKGTVLVAAWGLPSRAYEDDAARAAQAALGLVERLRALGEHPRVGVASGLVFCGERGDSRRCEYGLIGDPVNVAARLMQAAEAEALCDEATHAAARSRVDFDPPRRVQFKHRPDAVEAWRPRGRREPANDPLGAAAVMVGRAAERAVLLGALDALVAGRAGGRFVVEAEPGMGKSRLVADLIAASGARGARVLVGVGDAIETSSPYRAWRDPCRALLGLDGRAADPGAVVRAALSALDPALADHAPLLNGPAGLDLPDTAFSRQVTGQVRADNAHDLVVRVVERAAAEAPTLLVLEDAHWFDASSWALLAAVGERVPGLLVVVTTRPSGEAPAGDRARFLRAAASMRLDGLGDDDTLALVRARLGVAELPAPVAELIVERAAGNPFFGEELVLALRDSGAIAVEGGACRLVASDVRALALPGTLQGLITSRIDRLSAAEQVTLKVAAVIGRTFGLDVLRGAHPAADAPLDAHLARARAFELAQPVEAAAYAFKHAITRDVVDGLLLEARRRELHCAVAVWYERARADDLGLLAPLLGHHWERACEPSRALGHYEKAGEQALARGGYREAVYFFERVVECERAATAAGAAPSSRPRRVRWERLRGDAWFGLGDQSAMRRHMDAAMALAGHALPTDARGWTRAMLREVGRQVGHLVRAPDAARLSVDERALFIEAAAAAGPVSEQRYYETDIPGWLTCTLIAVNLAERAGDLGAAGRGYQGLGYLAGTLRMHGLARRWLDRAERLGDARTRGMAWAADGLYHQSFGRWAEAARCSDVSEQQLVRLGDNWALTNTLVMRAEGQFWRGELADALATADRGLALSRRSNQRHHMGWWLVLRVPVLLARGEVAAACAAVDECEALRADFDGQSLRRTGYNRLAVAVASSDPRVLDHARAVLDELRRDAPSPAFMDYGPLCVAAEAFLALWATGAWPDAAEGARRVVAVYAGLGRLFPPMASRWRRLVGELAWHKGDRKAAAAAWGDALRHARTHGNRLDEALAWRCLARIEGRRDEARERSRVLFQSTGAVAPTPET